MTVIKFIGVVVSLLIIIAVVGLTYLGYRYWGAQKAHHARFDSDLSGIPPVICNGKDTGFTSYDSVTTYYAHGAIRADALIHDKSGTTPFHLLVTPEKTFYTWNDNDRSGTSFRLPKTTIDSHFNAVDHFDLSVFTDSSCAPWWSVNEDIFSVPDGISFVDISQ